MVYVGKLWDLNTLINHFGFFPQALLPWFPILISLVTLKFPKIRKGTNKKRKVNKTKLIEDIEVQ
jgi:hypothetical protein